MRVITAAGVENGKPAQAIRFVTCGDGAKLAYALTGSGIPIVNTGNWLSHLEYDWHSPVWRHWFALFARHSRLLRYDSRGSGLSDWSDQHLAIEQQVSDLERIVEAAGVERFPLIGMSLGAAIAVEYAVRHPSRVSHLILYGGCAQGWARRGHAQQMREGAALVETIRVGWGRENPAFRQLFASLSIPDATDEQARWFAELMHRTTRPDVAARHLECLGDIDVKDRLALVRAPTLVLHVRNDSLVPFEQGRVLAAGIPGAHFVALEGRNHILLENEPSWPRLCAAVGEFLGIQAATRRAFRGAPTLAAELTCREMDILRLVAAGASNLQISGQLFISEKTVRNHLTSIFDKLGVSSRAQAIVLARDSAIVRDAAA